MTRLGITESLDAPGLVTLPPVSSGATKLAQLQQDLGLVGAVASDAGILRRRAALDMQRAEEQARVALEGQATLDMQTTLPGVLSDIDSRNIAPAEGQTPEAAAALLVEQNTLGFPAAYQEQYRARALPILTAAFVKQREGIKMEARDDDLAARAARVGVTGTTDEAAAIVDEAVGLHKIGRAEALDKLVLPGLRAAAINGNAERFASLKAVLGDHAPDDVARAEAQLLEGAARVETAAHRDFANDIGGLYVDRETGGGVSFDSIKRRIGEYRGIVADRHLDDAYRELEIRQRQERHETELAVKRVAVQQFAEDRYAFVKTLMSGGSETGGAATIKGQKFTLEFPDGTTEKIDADVLIERAVVDRFSEIDREFPTDPDKRFGNKVDYLSRQGGGAIYSPWKRAMNSAVYQGARTDLTEATVPPVVKEGVELFRRMEALGARGVLNAHLTDDESRNFLRTVDLFLSGNKGATTVEQAIMQTSQVSADRAFSRHFQRTAQPAAVLAAAVSLAGGAANMEDVRSFLDRRAELYKISAGIGDNDAISRASKDFDQEWTQIGDTWSYIGSRDVPPVAILERVTDAMDTFYTAKATDRYGIKKGDIHYRFDSQTGVLSMTDENGYVLPESPELQPSDLRSLARYAARLDTGQILAKDITSGPAERRASRINASLRSPVPIMGINSLLSKGVAAIVGTDDTAESVATKVIEDSKEIPTGIPPHLRPLYESIRDTPRKHKFPKAIGVNAAPFPGSAGVTP